MSIATYSVESNSSTLLFFCPKVQPLMSKRAYLPSKPEAEPICDENISTVAHFPAHIGLSAEHKRTAPSSNLITMDDYIFRPQEIPEGVVIPLRPLSTQLIFTFIFAVTELFFASAVLVFHAFSECKALERGKALNVKSHSIRTKTIQLLALVMFLTLETVVSTFTMDFDRGLNSDQNCFTVSARQSSVFNDTQSSTEESQEEAIVFGCLQRFVNNTLSISAGSYSVDSGIIQCSEGPLLSYESSNFVKEQFAGRAYHSSCNDNFCAAILSEGRSVFLSNPYTPPETFEGKIVGIWTNLSYDASELLEGMAVKLANCYAEGVFDELRLRIKLFSEKRMGQCNMFVSKRKETVLPCWMLVLSASMWITSSIIFIIARVVKRRVFYDIEDPMDWAAKTCGFMETEGDKKTAYVQFRGDGDLREVVVTHKRQLNSSEEVDTCIRRNLHSEKAHDHC